MAETPNKDIEKQLRDYAQRRRDAAGTPVMHPATRAMLQAEVKQLAGTATGAAPAAAQRTGWAIFWPRFAFAFAIVAIIGLAGIFFFPPGNKTKDNFIVAKLDESVTAPTEADKLKAFPPLSPEPVSAPAAPIAMNEVRREAVTKAGAWNVPTSVTSSLAKSERSDMPATRPVTTRALKSAPSEFAIVGYVSTNSSADSSTSFAAKPETGTILSDSNAKKSAGSFAGASSAAPGKSARGAVSGGQLNVQVQSSIRDADQELKDRSFATAGVTYDAKNKDLNRSQLNAANDSANNMAQRYRNVAVTDDTRRSGKINVLEEFTVEQNGQALTIVDRDGSVYNGFARQTGTERQNINAESGNPIQMVPNSNNGGRGGAAMNQTTMNRAYSQNQAPGQGGGSQNLGAAQTTQLGQNAPEPQTYFFRVEGTNRSLNQRVIVVGNMLQNNAGNVQNIGNSQAFKIQQNAPAGNVYNFNNGQAPVFNNFINGRVQLDNAKAVEFNASSVGQQ